MPKQERRKIHIKRRRDKNRNPSSERIHNFLKLIANGHYQYYVRGGVCRATGQRLSAMRVANEHGLDMNQCLFEIADARIEKAVFEHQVTVITPN